ncbi:thioredoxin domain-containing protein [Candidatus Peregrinibacteria bacterium]|nr:thioredoxin domain-containing protein [Candidatus Peregrinibacteria bacterium]
MNSDTKQLIKWLIIGLIIIGGFIAMIFAGGGNGGSGGTASEVKPDEWIKGDIASTVTLIEYSDIQCPACKAREPFIKDILNEFGSHMRFVYRHFPLIGVHDKAQISAQATEAAGLQGKFWEMHDLLFERQQTWSLLGENDAKNTFISYAEELGLDKTKFENDLESDAAENFVNEDAASGNAARVKSTPTFFLNGQRITPQDYDEFRQLIRDAIEAASAVPAN